MPWGQKSEGRRGREARVVPTNTGELEEGQRNDHREGRHWVITDARFFLPLTKPIRGCQLVDEDLLPGGRLKTTYFKGKMKSLEFAQVSSFMFRDLRRERRSIDFPEYS